MIDYTQLRDLVIIPALSDLQMYSDDARELLVFTCATESLGGTFLKQKKGPAVGIMQMEPNTYTDIWVNFLFKNPSMLSIMGLKFDCPRMPQPERMIYDLRFAVAMARIHYRRVKEQLPDHTDIDAIWEYYKKYYNTPLGKAKKDVSIKHYESFIKG